MYTKIHRFVGIKARTCSIDPFCRIYISLINTLYTYILYTFLCLMLNVALYKNAILKDNHLSTLFVHCKLKKIPRVEKLKKFENFPKKRKIAALETMYTKKVIVTLQKNNFTVINLVKTPSLYT